MQDEEEQTPDRDESIGGADGHQHDDDRPKSYGPSFVDGLIEILHDLEADTRRELLSDETQLASEELERVDRLIEQGGREADLSALLEKAFTDDAPEAIERQLARIAERGGRRARFHETGPLGKGGMGIVRAARDSMLRREVALKTIRPEALWRGVTGLGWLRRFVDEAQITAQLEHPTIPPVHDIGVDEEGRPFFAMQRVRGRALGDVLKALKAGDELDGVHWTLERVVEVVRRAGEGVAYAHSRGVLHRDLKPDNIMVGQFGAVYVMDWGLARVFGRDAAAAGLHAPPPAIETQRTESGESPLATVAGTVMGTIQYMAPEQAEPDCAPGGPLTDVYALGAILYRVLAGHAPYGPTKAGTSQDVLLEQVRSGPPSPLEQEAPHTNPALRAICERAMERRPEDRYPSVADLVADLDAFLERRVVRAYRTGPLVQAAKWVERNRALAVSLAAVALVTVFGAVGWRLSAINGVLAKERAEKLVEAERTRLLLELPSDAELRAFSGRESLPLDPDSRDELEQTRAKILELLDDPRSQELFEDLIAKNPVDTSLSGATSRDSLRSVLEGRRHDLLKTVETIRAQAPSIEDVAQPFLDEIDRRLDELSDSRTASSMTPRARQEGNVLDAFRMLRSGIEPFEVPLASRDGITVGTQLALLDRIEEIQGDPLVRQAWVEAQALFLAEDGPYGPTTGALRESPLLVPLGLDPDSRLLEFAHAATGDIPARDDEGQLQLDADSAVVLVLLPGGDAVLGSAVDGRRNVDPYANERDGPEYLVRLDPFLMGKHELSQAQFERLAGYNPSTHAPGSPTPDGTKEYTGLHPVETVSYDETLRVLRVVGMTLPTLAQSEYASRAGEVTPWWTGDAPESLSGQVNLLDVATLQIENRPTTWRADTIVDSELVDPWATHAPIDWGTANGFSLHNVTGNVHEWCLDMNHPYDGSDGAWLLMGSGERAFLDDRPRTWGEFNVARGGSFTSEPSQARSAYRLVLPSGFQRENLGIRPAMRVRISED